MTQTIDTPAIRSVRKTGPGAWLVVFEDGLRYPCVGGFRDEDDVRESTLAIRADARTCRHEGAPFTVARAESGHYRTVTEAGSFSTRDEADLAAQRLADETGIRHESFYGEAEGYDSPF